jgi:hypothetical protein
MLEAEAIRRGRRRVRGTDLPGWEAGRRRDRYSDTLLIFLLKAAKCTGVHLQQKQPIQIYISAQEAAL